ncbi:MAG: hypothetical protein FE78DRAFT_544000 [Acidomyces sp. 'richmondensis']|nr:MAG: hypothetical protein FE78DRAFT_544000 [Acidomyces sp. 'richmondensis']
MACHFAADIFGSMPGIYWLGRFCKRRLNELISGYLKPLDSVRKKVDSECEHQL